MSEADGPKIPWTEAEIAAAKHILENGSLHIDSQGTDYGFSDPTPEEKEFIQAAKAEKERIAEEKRLAKEARKLKNKKQPKTTPIRDWWND